MLQPPNNSQQPEGFSESSGATGGRPFHSHWYGYSKKSEKGKTIAQCIKCKQFIRNTAIKRMQLHRKKCHLDPDDEDSEARIAESDASSPTTSNTQTKIKHFFRKVTKTDKERLDIWAARFFSLAMYLLLQQAINTLRNFVTQCNQLINHQAEKDLLVHSWMLCTKNKLI
ncbi:uncharacterized protein LOC131994008 [Stomoxys calcitrans]|uniref:uncharacterized protein LOC131994008 n=1 Tax=Stomoxys calcitrans TaxID=35570 RepID=UPI0027E31057|nr:uncharacterized protein LOC131994008 [Stomoxys calcitrans]